MCYSEDVDTCMQRASPPPWASSLRFAIVLTTPTVAVAVAVSKQSLNLISSYVYGESGGISFGMVAFVPASRTDVPEAARPGESALSFIPQEADLFECLGPFCPLSP